MRKHIKWIFLLLILCLPLLWINVKDSVYWHDDFATYIHQAQNIIEGKPQGATGFIFNTSYFMGPPAYPVGFPILLAPFYALFGHSIYVYQLLMSVILILFILVMFHFLVQYMKPFYATIFCLIIAYNPNTIFLKGEIMCDILLAFFLLLNILCYESWKSKAPIIYAVLLAIINGFLISIKGTGIAFSAAILFMLALQLIQQHSRLIKQGYIFRNSMIAVFGGVLIYLLLNNILFPVPSGGLLLFVSVSKSSSYLDTILNNLDNYFTQYYNFFNPDMLEWQAFGIMTAAIMLTCALIGFLLKLNSRIALPDIAFILFVLIVLFYPHQAGIRFIFPILPFACYYIYLTAQKLFINVNRKSIVALLIGLFVLLGYVPGINMFIDHQHEIANGPQRLEAKEAIEFIRSQTDTNAVFNFRRPRALALYTQRKACCNFPWDFPSATLKNIDKLNVNYCMTNNQDINPALDSLIKSQPMLFNKVWNNSQYSIYKFR